MAKKLSWADIQSKYDQQWVELIDYDWPLRQAHPNSGIVRVHAANRKDFDRLLLVDSPSDSALIFVGASESPPDGIIPSMNLRRLTHAALGISRRLGSGPASHFGSDYTATRKITGSTWLCSRR